MQFQLIPEWYPQDAVMLTWPHQATDWRSILPQVEAVYLAICRAILPAQKLVIIAHNEAVKSHVKQQLQQANLALEQVHFVVCETNDTWARDHGPLCLKSPTQLNAQLNVLDCQFTGWGGKYPAEKDNQINRHLCNALLSPHASYQRTDFVLEGGAIEINEHGVLLTTRACVNNPNRNAQLSNAQIEQKLRELLGAKHILWLEHGYLAGDDTDSHIDTLARFAPNNTLVYVSCDDKNDEHYSELTRMQQQLSQFTTPEGEPYQLIPLPWVQKVCNSQGERLPATYANYLIINNKVLVPTYQDNNDALALSQIAKAYPKHQIIGIDCLALIQQFGSLHCITMQLPRGFLE